VSDKQEPCPGWPPYQRRCRKRVNPEVNDVWCPDCNARRIESLSSDLRYILALEAKKASQREKEVTK